MVSLNRKIIFFPENEIIAATAREIEDLELNEEQAIMTSRAPVRQAWR